MKEGEHAPGSVSPAAAASARYARVRELFLAACDRPQDERASLLVRACPTDPELRAEVEELLEIDHERLGRGEVLQPLPASIGGYRILGVLGRGGMGTVYRAEQQSPRREVALKVIRPECVSARSLRRFEHEAEILGRLDHEGIARIHEAGVAETAQGRQPYFAMELVRGRELTVWAEQDRPSLRKRLQLLALLCEAVQHAHLKGVVHRDLKPANVIVAADGRPRVLDFGVARTLDPISRHATVTADPREILGTLAYMSPEQIGPDPEELDCRSDVYALGVIGYELLGGRLPHEVESRPLADVVQAITTADPRPLGTIDRTLRGDLETIFGKALEKDPARRYASARALAEDLRRFLFDQPILARPPSTLYQLGKFAKRHRPLVAGSVLALAACTAAVWSAIRAEIERLHAREAALAAESARLRESQREEESRAARAAAVLEVDRQRRMLALVENLLENFERSRGAQSVKITDVLERAEPLVRTEFGDLPEFEADLHNLFGVAYLELGLPERAAEHLPAAAEGYERLHGRDDPRALAAASNLAGLYLSSGDLVRAEANARAVLSARERLLAPDHPDLALSRNVLAVCLMRQRKFSEALPLLRRSLEEKRSRLGDRDPATLKAWTNLGSCLLEIGDPESLEVLRQAHDLHVEALGGRDPGTLATLVQLANALALSGRGEEARHGLWSAFDPETSAVLAPSHPILVRARTTLGDMLAAVDPIAAEIVYRETIEAAATPGRLSNRESTLAANQLGALLLQQGRGEEAEAVLSEAVRTASAPSGPESIECATLRAKLARLLLSQGRALEAERHLAPAIASHLVVPRASAELGRLRRLRAQALSALGRLDEAQCELREAESIRDGGG